MLTIISQNAMYMAHFWQDKAFDLDEGANPEHYITQFLATGRNPETDPNGPELDGLDKLQGLAPLANHFINAPGLRVMILTPGSESHAPVPEYPAIIGAMEAQVRLILGGFTGDVDHIYMSHHTRTREVPSWIDSLAVLCSIPTAMARKVSTWPWLTRICLRSHGVESTQYLRVSTLLVVTTELF